MDRIKRWWVQCLTTLVTNSYIKGFLEGTIYKGKLKVVCSPGMNCYSCPGAVTSCPIGALQAVLGSAKYWYSVYVIGVIGAMGLILGRWICGFLCPFGWFQELLHKIKTPKFSVPKWLKPFKYLFLVVFVILLPLFVTNIIGIGDPAYCKYICPVGTLEGGIPLVLTNPSLKQAIGTLYYWKLSVLFGVIIWSVLACRPFCKVMCPLGAIYGLFNKISFYQYHVNADTCITCGKCEQVCQMDVTMYKSPNHTECIRCGDCKRTCPTGAISSGIHVGCKEKTLKSL